MNYTHSLLYRYTNKYFKTKWYDKKVPELVWLLIFIFTFIILTSIFASKESKTQEPLNTQLTHQTPLESSPRTVESILARVTCYTKTGNKMANGLYPKKGYVATSDRTIPFGTKIEIDGVEYEVGDRTNKRFQHFKNQTIDIFWEESEESCLKFGTSLKNIIIKQ